MPFQPDLFGFCSPARSEPALSNALEDYPHVSPKTISRHAKRIGRAGEFLVDSILTRYGDLILSAPEDQPFDRVIRRGDQLVTLQIKTSARAVDGFFKFSMKKGYAGSPGGIRSYGAMTTTSPRSSLLPENVVLFSADRRELHRIGLDQIEALRERPRASYLRALEEIGLLEPDELKPCLLAGITSLLSRCDRRLASRRGAASLAFTRNPIGSGFRTRRPPIPERTLMTQSNTEPKWQPLAHRLWSACEACPADPGRPKRKIRSPRRLSCSMKSRCRSRRRSGGSSRRPVKRTSLTNPRSAFRSRGRIRERSRAISSCFSASVRPLKRNRTSTRC